MKTLLRTILILVVAVSIAWGVTVWGQAGGLGSSATAARPESVGAPPALTTGTLAAGPASGTHIRPGGVDGAHDGQSSTLAGLAALFKNLLIVGGLSVGVAGLSKTAEAARRRWQGVPA